MGDASPQRIAIVIGNGAYRQSRPLDNPVNDAALITLRLSDLGFEIHGGATSQHHPTPYKAGMDLTSMQMSILIGEFTAKLKPGATAVIYYAGHGLQVGGKNFLVPVDDALDRNLPDLGLIDIKRKLETIADAVQGNGVVVVFLDACRDDPMNKDQRKLLLDLLDPGELAAEHGQEVSSTRSCGGLSTFKMARAEGTGRTFIGFATAPGDYAYDGKRGSINSPFARSLGAHLAIRGLEIEELYNRVSREVLETVAQEHPGKIQDPWSETNLNRHLFLFPRTAWPIAALGLGGLIAGFFICWSIFEQGGFIKPIPTWAWGLGLVFGLVPAAGTLKWGSGRLLDALLALLGPAFGFGLALAILQLVPPLPPTFPMEVTPSKESATAASAYWAITIAGGLLYLFATAMVWLEDPPGWPQSGVQWLRASVTWLLPFVIIGVLLRLEYYLSATNPLLTNIALFSVLGGIIYASSVALSCRAQRGNFSAFGPFTGAITVGLLVAALFAIYSMVAFRRDFSWEQRNVLLIWLGAAWHMLLGMQLGYCLVYYVPNPVKKAR